MAPMTSLERNDAVIRITSQWGDVHARGIFSYELHPSKWIRPVEGACWDFWDDELLVELEALTHVIDYTEWHTNGWKHLGGIIDRRLETFPDSIPDYASARDLRALRRFYEEGHTLDILRYTSGGFTDVVDASSTGTQSPVVRQPEDAIPLLVRDAEIEVTVAIKEEEAEDAEGEDSESELDSLLDWSPPRSWEEDEEEEYEDEDEEEEEEEEDAHRSSFGVRHVETTPAVSRRSVSTTSSHPQPFGGLPSVSQLGWRETPPAPPEHVFQPQLVEFGPPPPPQWEQFRRHSTTSQNQHHGSISRSASVSRMSKSNGKRLHASVTETSDDSEEDTTAGHQVKRPRTDCRSRLPALQAFATGNPTQQGQAPQQPEHREPRTVGETVGPSVQRSEPRVVQPSGNAFNAPRAILEPKSRLRGGSQGSAVQPQAGAAGNEQNRASIQAPIQHQGTATQPNVSIALNRDDNEDAEVLRVGQAINTIRNSDLFQPMQRTAHVPEWADWNAVEEMEIVEMEAARNEFGLEMEQAVHDGRVAVASRKMMQKNFEIQLERLRRKRNGEGSG